MSKYFDQSMQSAIERIRNHVKKMAALTERALQDCMNALAATDHQMAYAVILRDQYIDEMEKEIDRLCLDFIVRQQPVAQPLRFTFSTIKINSELERVGDYAESIARQLLRLDTPPPGFIRDQIIRLSERAIPMLHDAIQAFVGQDMELAQRTIETEETVDVMRTELTAKLVQSFHQQEIPFEQIDPLATIIRRLERVSDQARDICMEVLYMCTGEYVKHPGVEAIRILFVDQHNSCRSRMAEVIAQSLNLPNFIFSSAGLEPRPADDAIIRFMSGKGFDLTTSPPRAIFQIPNLDHHQVIVLLAPEARRVFPEQPQKVVYLDWSVADPTLASGSAEEIAAAYEKTFQFIHSHVCSLIKAIQGEERV